MNAIRAVIKSWEHTRGTCGPNPDGQLGQIVEVMLGTSARIGEVLAIRRCDLDVTTTPATLRICGTIVTERGVGTYRQPHPKTDRSNRVVALPTFTAEAIRRRLSVWPSSSAARFTIEHYSRRNEHVNPLPAELLDAAFSATEADDLGGELDE